MIVVDSSAVIAIFRQESDAEDYARSIAADDDPIMSAANLVEVSIVLRGLKRIAPEKAERWLDDFLKAAAIRIEPVTLDQAQAARSAHLQFGKGTGHSAALNYGDCFAMHWQKQWTRRCCAKGMTFRRPTSASRQGRTE
jgi:ribonuclease VapC